MLTAFVTSDKSYSFKTKEATIQADIKLSRSDYEFVSVSLFLLVCWVWIFLGGGVGCKLWGFQRNSNNVMVEKIVNDLF